MREFLKKIMKSIWNLFFYTRKKFLELFPCHTWAELLIWLEIGDHPYKLMLWKGFFWFWIWVSKSYLQLHSHCTIRLGFGWSRQCLIVTPFLLVSQNNFCNWSAIGGIVYMHLGLLLQLLLGGKERCIIGSQIKKVFNVVSRWGLFYLFGC